MKGSQCTVYAANQSHRKLRKTMVDWLLDEIAKAGIHGATVTEIHEAVDAHGKYHAARFLELADQPVAVTVAASDPLVDALLDSLRSGNVPLFYTRCPIEFELLGESDNHEIDKESGP